MHEIWFQAALWLGLALVATLVSIWLRISVALTEIVVGTVAQLMIGAVVGPLTLDASASWVQFLAGVGAIVLTFLRARSLTPSRSARAGEKRRSSGWFPLRPPSSEQRPPRGFCSAGIRRLPGWPASRCRPHQWRSFMPSCWSWD